MRNAAVALFAETRYGAQVSSLDYVIREDWIRRVPGMALHVARRDVAHRATNAQYLVVYEPGDATRYEVSFTPAYFANETTIARGISSWWQVSLWMDQDGTTMLVEAGDRGTCVCDLDWAYKRLRQHPHTARVMVIMINGCLASHDINVAREAMAKFNSEGGYRFVDPDDTSALRELED